MSQYLQFSILQINIEWTMILILTNSDLYADRSRRYCIAKSNNLTSFTASCKFFWIFKIIDEWWSWHFWKSIINTTSWPNETLSRCLSTVSSFSSSDLSRLPSVFEGQAFSGTQTGSDSQGWTSPLFGTISSRWVFFFWISVWNRNNKSSTKIHF